MTRDEIMKLEGRELAEAVATEVMEWTALREPGKAHLWMPPEHFISGWRPDRDIADAMLLVEKLVADGYYVDIGIDKYGAQVQLNYYTGSEKRWTHGESLRADTLPLAICRAALLAKENTWII